MLKFYTFIFKQITKTIRFYIQIVKICDQTNIYEWKLLKQLIEIISFFILAPLFWIFRSFSVVKYKKKLQNQASINKIHPKCCMFLLRDSQQTETLNFSLFFDKLDD